MNFSCNFRSHNDYNLNMTKFRLNYLGLFEWNQMQLVLTYMKKHEKLPASQQLAELH